MTTSNALALARAQAPVRATRAEEAAVDLTTPLDDETMKRKAGSVRERLA
jgi:hypothetical protein